MTGAKHTLEWLEHRAGLRKLSDHPRRHLNRALELNDTDKKGAAFTAAYGNKEIKGFVGFVDLIGFSTKVAGLPPSGMSQYLNPFLLGVAEIAVKCGALVDKTVGDELMFVLPDTEEEGGVSGILEIRYLVVLLHNLQRELGPHYPFRFGISYGFQFVDHVEVKGYSEWTVVGESVNLAKRLQTLPGAEPNDNFGGAFGVLVHETSEQTFQACLGHMAGEFLPMKGQVVEGEVKLKGISSPRCAILSPKVPSSKWHPGMQFD